MSPTTSRWFSSNLRTRPSPMSIPKAGRGRLLVVGGRCEALEGDRRPRGLVVLGFPDVARVQARHASSAYQAILPIRLRHARTYFVTLVEGLRGP